MANETLVAAFVEAVQSGALKKLSMPYDRAMRWKRELEALGATVEVS